MSGPIQSFHRPCLVLTLRDPARAIDVSRRFRRQGWDVYATHGGPEARRLTRMLEADLVILDDELDEESGYLTCAKLTRERPGVPVVLVSENAGPGNRGLADFVGAATLVERQDCLPSLLASSRRPIASAG